MQVKYLWMSDWSGLWSFIQVAKIALESTRLPIFDDPCSFECFKAVVSEDDELNMDSRVTELLWWERAGWNLEVVIGEQKKTSVILKHAWNQHQRWKTFQNVPLDKKHEPQRFDKKIEPCPYRQDIYMNHFSGLFKFRCIFSSLHILTFRNWPVGRQTELLQSLPETTSRSTAHEESHQVTWKTWWNFSSNNPTWLENTGIFQAWK